MSVTVEPIPAIIIHFDHGLSLMSRAQSHGHLCFLNGIMVKGHVGLLATGHGLVHDY